MVICWSCGKEIKPKERFVVEDGQPIHEACKFLRRRRAGLPAPWPDEKEKPDG